MRYSSIGVVMGVLASAAALAEDPVSSAGPEAVEAGRIQFAQTCSYCHGFEGSGGKAGMLKGRTDLTADYLYETISNGKRSGSQAMPAWKYSLDDPTIRDLVAYVLSLQAKPTDAGQ